MEKLDGQIERVVFRNEENGFCVLRVKVRGQKELVTVTGTTPAINAGEWMAADGKWLQDPRHGRQFKADKMRTSKPDTLEGIEKLLSHGGGHCGCCHAPPVYMFSATKGLIRIDDDDDKKGGRGSLLRR